MNSPYGNASGDGCRGGGKGKSTLSMFTFQVVDNPGGQVGAWFSRDQIQVKADDAQVDLLKQKK